MSSPLWAAILRVTSLTSPCILGMEGHNLVSDLEYDPILFKLPSGREIPMERLAQRDDALIDQLYDLWAVGMRLGMFDAADWLNLRIPRKVQHVLREVCAQREAKSS